MMGSNGGGQQVPPGFRFHPTDEELLYYYLRKKVSYEPIDLDVIREVDLNKLEPWDLKDKCGIGSGPQNEWYLFSHKDKKYPTGSRTNRATTAGFWKATGRDKAILLGGNKRIGLRKTLVFYTGRAPHGHKTDWIMHEYRLLDSTNINIPPPPNPIPTSEPQEDGWVVCRVFKKKNLMISRSPPIFESEDDHLQQQLQETDDHMNKVVHASGDQLEPNKHFNYNNYMQLAAPPPYVYDNYPATLFDGSSSSSMHLPQLLTSPHDHHDYCSGRNLLSLSMCAGGLATNKQPPPVADWSFLDKLLASHQHQPQLLHDQPKCNDPSSSFDDHDASHRFPFQYLANYETHDILKLPK